MLALIAVHDEWVELRALTYFEAVVRCGGFTRAAEDLRIAQPAVSAQVRALERELGVDLLARTTRRVSLTGAGELVLARTRRVLAELDGVRDDAADVRAVRRGRVVVGATGVLGGFDLPAVLADFARHHPGVTLSLRTGFVDEMVAELGAGALDLVLGPVHAELPATVAVHPLAADRLVLLAPPGWPVGGPASWDGLPFVCLPVGSGLRDVLEATAARYGVRFPVRFEATTPAGVRALVAAGLGVALMAASATADPGAPVDVHEIVPPIAHPPFGVLHREPLSPAARAQHALLVTAGSQEPAGS